MDDVIRWFWVGSRDLVRRALERAFSSPPLDDALHSARSGDLVVVDSQAGRPETSVLSGGHVFAGVRALKAASSAKVCVVVDADDRVGVQLARFCLADGVLRWHPESKSLDTTELDRPARSVGSPGRPSVDDLLARVERELDSSGGQESTVQRMLRFEHENTLLHKLQDPETGLFDGPYATWKLDEEWRRANRFHEPLSLVLLDLGAGLNQLADAERRSVLMDAASVFLNECRDIDILARFSPTTFLFLLPGTGTDGAEILAQRTIASLGQRLPKGAGLAFSCGIATVPSSHIPDRKAFLLVAEACLRRAQAAPGGGQVATTWQ